MEDLDAILDTPSKRTLWMYIIPLLTQLHQDVVRQKVKNKQQSQSTSSGLNKQYLSFQFYWIFVFNENYLLLIVETYTGNLTCASMFH